MIERVEVLAPSVQLDHIDEDIVEAGSQSTVEDSDCVSADIAVKSSEVKVSVILHVIDEPSTTLTVDAVFELLAATERFEDKVV